MIENVGRRSDNWSEPGAPTDVGDASLNGFERNALFWNRGDREFVDVGYLTGSNLVEDGRGVAVADFDRDGKLDLLVANLEKPAALLMGGGVVGNWLQVELEGTRGNRDAIGAVLVARVGDRRQTRQVSAGSGYLASSWRVAHFGLADAETVDSIEIRWPSGARQTLEDVPANQRLKVREPSSRPTAGSR